MLLKDLEGARTVATSIETGVREGILKDIAAAECQQGDFQAAIRTFQSIKNGQAGCPKDEAARIIAAERTRLRDPKTLAWAEQLDTPSQKTYALLGIVDGLNSRSK
jgi:hypothetical protein